jgi:riboflavin kinase/FMN adenylyltransferase
MTFDPHPPRIVRPDKAPPLLMTKAQRLEALADAGLHGAAIVRFTPELSRWDPEMFVRTVLVEWLHVSEVWVGANFLFGHDRAGNFSMLRTLGARYGFKAEKIDPVRYKDFVVSSTRIRRLLGEGRVDEAGALLGHQYFIDGTVIRGDQRGRTIGFPTANLCSENELLPPHGVYATTVRIGDVVYSSVTNVGTRPTVDNSGRTVVETHIFDFGRDLYGQPIRVGFVQRLRDERAFESLDLLKGQIDADCQRARVLFNRLSL